MAARLVFGALDSDTGGSGPPVGAANGFLDGVLNSDMDSQRICFEQGKALIYMSGQDSKVIIAKELGVVVKHRRISDAAVTRTWPDGRVDHLHRGDPEDLACPYIPPTSK